MVANYFVAGTYERGNIYQSINQSILLECTVPNGHDMHGDIYSGHHTALTSAGIEIKCEMICAVILKMYPFHAWTVTHY